MGVELLNEAFENFTRASKSLETYYEHLQGRVRYLTTELEKKNDDLEAALDEAEKNKDHLDAVLSSLEEAIIVVDPEDCIVMVNRAAEELLDAPQHTFLGRPFNSLDWSLSSDGSDTVLRAGGRRYHVILSRSPVEDKAGAVRGTVVLVKDITRMRELEAQHERNQRLISMGEMAAKIVHEIRNPLCSIALFSSMLEKDLQERPQKELAQGISTGINSLNTILTNMLLFARPHKPTLKRIRLDAVAEGALSIFPALLESRHIRLEKRLIPAEIDGDSELLKQVAMNIAMNAVQAMPDGGELAVTMSGSGTETVLSFRDSGVGIAKENLETIFDPFFSTKDAGTGLGLAISSKIMQAHGGYISVESEPGRGSTFILRFPKGE